MTRPAKQVGLPFAMRLVLSVFGGLVAALLLWLSATVHLERACTLLDTPYLSLCDEPAVEDKLERQRKLRTHLAANPGDSAAWIQLTNLETGKYQKALFRASATLAPADPNVLMWRAGEALGSAEYSQAVGLLVELIEHRGKGEAAQALARIVASGQGTPLLRPHLATANRWLPQVLASLTTLKLPLTSAVPIVAEAAAKGTVTPQTLQSYVRTLKADGQWTDAYSLWLMQQRGPTPLLFNGSFDQPFQPDGFDWEVTPTLQSRAGAVVRQRGSVGKGQVLDLEFTGRPMAVPFLRQYLFAAPGKYTLKGQYMSSRLRTEQGMAWSAVCLNTSASSAATVVGRSSGLQDTAGAWQSFQFRVVIPAACSPVVSLQLEPFAPFEAAAGMKGRAAFDALELVPQRL